MLLALYFYIGVDDDVNDDIMMFISSDQACCSIEDRAFSHYTKFIILNLRSCLFFVPRVSNMLGRELLNMA